MKYWRLSYKEAISEISYQNLILLNMSIPKYDKEGNKVEAPSEITGKDFLSRFVSRKK
ncbi:hypothetical protein [Sphingobacterium sp. 1.A.5]|uniref:hypothetical protein n=1 Tax=Sphingobacterium sp. 1.A.5 TaxID=2044604 RepID=UPI0015D4D20E|nr:hypothetical protein [Sphingobacterium sp. 1.A.5]